MRATARRNGPRLRVMDELDDLSLPPVKPRPGLKALATSTLRRLAGAGLLALGLYVTLALWGYDPADPSFNQATSAPVSNPAGAGGAWLADLLYQFFGYGAFVPVIAALSWGMRMLLDRRLAWPWLPVLALPPAMLATCAFLASRKVPGPEDWPFRVGLGGFVGDFQFLRLGPGLGGPGQSYSCSEAIARGSMWAT